MDKNMLAQSGMYYTGVEDKCKCHFCGVEISRWEILDCPIDEHKRFSPNCSLLRRRHTDNVPLDNESLNRTLPPISYDVCGSMAPHTFYPSYSEYAIVSKRLRTYGDWPKYTKQKPIELSAAGFFYTGVGDHVKCFSCRGTLKDWNDTDQPWEKHALWLNNCNFVKVMKGEVYIESIKLKYKKKQEEIQEQQQEPVLPGDGRLCKICYLEDYNTIFIPCGHILACENCATSVTKCPICRKEFSNVVRAYFP
ncbi:inhibitor of apoptosis [Lasius niger]|uniref:Inhibitor of apoptosis n=1 Tax=Lasius niger TaxID=67767 RepID=A0A0J7JYX2_LASNI|nr:inhibitor of apoptosis [Lasius niger]